MTNIVIPCAGAGKRFKDAGYKTSKPLIKIDGLSLINTVIINLGLYSRKESLFFNGEGPRFIIICQKEDYEAIKGGLDPLGQEFKYLSNIEYIQLDYLTKGSACTCLLAKEFINNNDELIIANSDQIIKDYIFNFYSILHYRENNADGGILCFLNDSPKWSYVRINGDRIIQVVEKQVVSNLATVGIYYWKHGKYFVDSAERMIKNGDVCGSEFYTAPSYNYMISDGMKVIPYMVNKMIGLGTPKDVEQYLNRHNK